MRRHAAGVLTLVAACTPFGVGEGMNTDDGGAESSVAETGPGDASISPYAALVLSDGPIAYWRFGEKAGATVARSEVGGTVMQASIIGQVQLGTAGAIPGDPDTCFEFPQAPGPIVEAADGAFDFQGNAPFSLEAWFRPMARDGTFRHLFIKDAAVTPREEYGVFFNDSLAGGTNNGLTFERFTLGESSYVRIDSSEVALDVWHHLVATYDGQMMRLYLDGASKVTTADPKPLGAKTLPLRIGAKTPGYGPLRGAMDEVAVYDKPLAAERVKAHFDAGPH